MSSRECGSSYSGGGGSRGGDTCERRKSRVNEASIATELSCDFRKRADVDSARSTAFARSATSRPARTQPLYLTPRFRFKNATVFGHASFAAAKFAAASAASGGVFGSSCARKNPWTAPS